MPIYTRADLEARVNAGIKNKIGLLVNREATINEAVRALNSETDLRSTRRVAAMHPGIFNDQLAYPLPVDLKARRIVSISKNAGNNVYFGFNLLNYEQFNAKYGYVGRYNNGSPTDVNYGQRELFTAAFDDLSMVRRLLLAAPQDGTNQEITTLDSLTAGGGLWTSFGDAFNVDVDTGNFIRGNASIGFDINGAGGTTAGIYNATLTPFSLSEFMGEENSIFSYVYLSNAEGVDNITLRIGNNAANYYQFAVTLTHFGTELAVGWNLLRFDVTSMTTVGTVDNTNLTYIAEFMTKQATKISEAGFNFDNLVVRSGDQYNLRYYSKYPWQSVLGVWKENSTQSDDFLNMESDEFDMAIDKGITIAGIEVDENSAVQAAQVRYDRKLALYTRGTPSEALVETVDYQAQYYI